MKKSKSLNLTLIILIFCLFNASGEEKKDSSSSFMELERMVVRAQKGKITGYNVIDSTTILTSTEAKSIDGILADQTGIDLKRTSPAAGKGTGVIIRGLDESRALILLNGRPLNGAGVMGGDYVDWSLLPLYDVKKIEILRGIKTAEYGNTIGGVINIITRGDVTAPSATKIRASYGVVSPKHTQDAYKKMATDLSFLHHANILNRASFDFFATYATGEPYLRNNYYKKSSAGGELSILLPYEVRMNAGFRYNEQLRGFAIANSKDSANYNPNFPESKESGGGGPGLPWKGGNFYYGDRSYWRNIRTQADLSLQKKFFENFLVTAMVHLNDQYRTEYYYALNDTNHLVLERYAKPEDKTRGFIVVAHNSIGNNYTLKYGVDGISLRYSNSDIRECDTSFFRSKPEESNPNSTVKAADRYGIFVQSFLKFIDKIEISPGARYDYYIGFKREGLFEETKAQGISPNLGVSVKTWKDGKISLNGAYAYRFPTCPELYWYYAGYRPVDRKKLLPERAMQGELGLLQELSLEKIYGSFEIRGYYYRIKDYLRTIFGYQPSRLVYNIDLVTFIGFEAEASVNILKNIRLKANYTYQISEKVGDTYDNSIVLTKGLPELPKHKGNFGIEYNILNSGVAGLSMRYVGKREVIVGNLARANATTLEYMKPFMVFRLYGDYMLWTKDNFSVKLKAGIDNLFNTKYEEYPGIPMPGVTGTTTIELSF